ncbi:MAG: hypothetical protein IJI12_02435 [Atopobiaceae bacterium]|nr:hypothetical protein [Atopobiaceae bacterium]
MACIAFIASIVLCSAVSALVKVDTGTSRTSQPDYHFVPFAGDVWGA